MCPGLGPSLTLPQALPVWGGTMFGKENTKTFASLGPQHTASAPSKALVG